MKLLYSFLLLFIAGPAFSQVFITLDEDTAELIEDVNYSVFKDKQVVSAGVTSLKELNTITVADFDSITFTRVDYVTKALTKEQLDTLVYLKKKIIYLDEAVVTNKKKEQIVLGEQNRFVKSQSRPLLDDMSHGVVMRNQTGANLLVKGVAIFTEKVKYTTQYKISFYKVEESMPVQGNQDIRQQELVFATDTLTLKEGAKGKVDIAVSPGYSLKADDKIMVAAELINYYDDNGNVYWPESGRQTKLKFQLSDRADYYAKLINMHTRELTPNLRNINLMINYDFAYQFFKKPHKSIIVAPAILLYAEEEK